MGTVVSSAEQRQPCEALTMCIRPCRSFQDRHCKWLLGLLLQLCWAQGAEPQVWLPSREFKAPMQHSTGMSPLPPLLALLILTQKCL